MGIHGPFRTPWNYLLPGTLFGAELLPPARGPEGPKWDMNPLTEAPSRSPFANDFMRFNTVF